MRNIVSHIICSEYEHRWRKCGLPSAMKVVFSLTNDYDVEDGYRHLEILVYDFGNRYVGVFGKADWNVIRNEWSDGYTLDAGHEYVKGATPYVLYGHHDSCWREAVETILREYEKKIVLIDCVFGGLTKPIRVDDDLKKLLKGVITATPGYGGHGVRAKLSDLEFQFEKETVV